jgi:hypothetical protein
MFRYLGWDIFNENRVIFEDMTSTKKRVDATFVFEDNSKFLVEVKRLTHKLVMKDFEQLTLYINSDESANFGILTNGIDYWLADNKQEGLDAKRIHAFNVFDMSECDLNILRMFFSFDPSYKLKDINRYINYIRTGLDFGDKKCEKVLEIKNFESDEIRAKQNNNHEDIINSKNSSQDDKNLAFKKPVFAPVELPFVTNNSNQEKDKEDDFEQMNLDCEIPKTNNSNSVVQNKSQIDVELNNLNIKEDLKFENKIIDKNINKDEIIKIPFNGKGEKIEFFELIERNRAKIFLNNEYHIIADIGFPSLFIKMLRHVMKEIKLYPALFSKVITSFPFIEESSNKGGKFEPIHENYVYNVSVNNYTKLKNIESLLKFIHENFE